MNFLPTFIAIAIVLGVFFVWCISVIKNPPKMEIEVESSNRQTLLSFENNKAVFNLHLTTSIGELEDVTAFYCFDSNTFVLQHENQRLNIDLHSQKFIGAVMGWLCEHYNCSCEECSPAYDPMESIDCAADESFCLSS